MKDKIVVTYSSIIINNYNIGDCPKLEKSFKIWVKAIHGYKIFGMYYDEENKQLYLPRGIDIWYIENCFDTKASYLTTPDDYSYMNDDSLLCVKPRDKDQIEALKFLTGLPPYQESANRSQLFINLPTGKGKSFCSIAACSYINMKYAVITYSTDCLKQWNDYILKYSNMEQNRICLIKGSGVINRLMQNGTEKYDVFLISHDTIKSYATQYGWNSISKLFKILKIGIKIIDEAHKNFTNTTMIDYFTNTKKTFYVTATKERSSQDENKIFQLYFKNVLSIELFHEDVDPHTKYKALMFNSNPTPHQISSCRNGYGLNRTAYIDYITDNDNFYKALTFVIDITISHNAKTLIYIGINEAIIKVAQWLEETFPQLHNNIGIFTSLTEKENKRNELDKLVILSTTKSCGEAIDIKDLKITVVAAEPFKSSLLAKQTLGRTRNNNTIYIEFVDSGFQYIKEYYYAKKSTFAKYALSCEVIRCNQAMLDNISNDILRKYSLTPMIGILNTKYGDSFRPMIHMLYKE